ncbi:MAG: respiratory nitrate reductase subunit gamma [Candidatus Eisenbacteria bacterium]
MADKIYFVILVPMVYLAVAIFVFGIGANVIRMLAAPRHPFPLRIHPARKAGGLWAIHDTFLMPQARRHAPFFWIFLMLYHLAFLLLILSHLDLFPGVHLMPPDSPHMLGWGAVGVVLTVSVCYFLLRRMRGPVREISTFGDYLLLLLLLFLMLSGDMISWANSWNEAGFVISKQDFGAYLQSLLGFGFENPRDILPGSHYIVVVIHVFLANLFLMVLPFTKIMHTFFALPMNRLRRG